MIPALPLGPLSGRKRHRGEILRDAARGRALRADPAEPWVPTRDELDRTRRLLRAGGREGPPPGLRDLLSDPARLVPVPALAGPADDAARLEQAADQGAVLLAVATDEALGGRPGRLASARRSWEGRLLQLDYPLDEFDLALAAALGAHGLTVCLPLLRAPLPSLLAAARCYALELLVELRTDRDLDEALASGAAGLLLPRGRAEDHERPERVAARVPSGIPLLFPGPLRSRAEAHRLRRAGADAALVPPDVLDGVDEDPAEEPEPDDGAPALDLQALGEALRSGEAGSSTELLLASLQGFAASGSSGLLLPTAPAAAPEPELPPEPEAPEEPPTPLGLLAVARPRGYRPG